MSEPFNPDVYDPLWAYCPECEAELGVPCDHAERGMDPSHFESCRSCGAPLLVLIGTDYQETLSRHKCR